ncbi:MAG: DMT family transporter [Bacteroidota bacterium]
MKQYIAHLALVAVALIYAFNYFIAKDLFKEISPLGVVAIRSMVAIIFFWLIQIFWIREKIQSRKDYLRFFVCGMLGIALNQIFFFSGLDRTVEVNASVLMTTTPVFVFLLGFFMRVEKLSALRILGLGLAATGAVLLIQGGESLSIKPETLVGDLMVIFNASVYGLYLVLVRPLVQRYHPMTIMVWVFSFGALLTLPVGIPSLLKVDWPNLTQPAVWAVVYVVLFTTIGAYSFNAIALKRVPSTTAGIYIYLQPVLVSVLAFFLLEEGVSLKELAFIAMVLLGVYLVSYKKSPN